MPDIDGILENADAGLSASFVKFLELLRFASVSSSTETRDDVAGCARWLAGELQALDFAVEIVETVGHPIILAKADGKADTRVLFYGHYDVQPAEPLAAWCSPPFEPKIIDEGGLTRVYARGASDSKSQFWSVIEALRAWKAVRGELPFSVTIMLEGEEEAGSPSLPAFVETYRDALSCDVAFICDASMWSATRPAITTKLKGLIHEKITIYAPNGDLHSGHFGNVVVNPIRVLTSILASFHAVDGRVLVNGFYDDVDPIPTALLQQWGELALAEALKGASVAGAQGETDRGHVERMWGRPGIDLNGVSGGNIGASERSVLPGSAFARLTARLVDRQQPDDIRRKIRQHVLDHLPQGCRAEFEGEGGSAAVSVNVGSPYLAATARGLDAEWPEPTLFQGTGGAIPLVGLLTNKLRVDCIVTGFILGDDSIHGPDERYDLERLRKGIRSWVRIIAELEEHR